MRTYALTTGPHGAAAGSAYATPWISAWGNPPPPPPTTPPPLAASMQPTPGLETRIYDLEAQYQGMMSLIQNQASTFQNQNQVINWLTSRVDELEVKGVEGPKDDAETAEDEGSGSGSGFNIVQDEGPGLLD